MRRIGMSLAAGALLGAIGCAQHGPSPARPPATPVKTPVTAAVVPRSAEDCDRMFAERLNAGDVEGVVALYEPTATLVGPNGTDATGIEAIRKEITGLVALKPAMVMNVKRTVTGGDVAVLYNDWHATGTDPMGKKLRFSGKAIEIVRRQADGSWRYVIDDADARGRR